MNPRRLALALVILSAASAACTSSEGDGAGGSGGGGGTGGAASCELPEGSVPGLELRGPDGEPAEEVTGAVTVSDASSLTIDACVGASVDCAPLLHELTAAADVLPAIPVGTLVTVLVTPLHDVPAGPIHTENEPTVTIVNVPSIDGVTSETASDEAYWFLRSSSYGCGAPGLEVMGIKTCESQGGSVSDTELSTDTGPLRLTPGDVVEATIGGITYSVDFRGSYHSGEAGACRWLVNRAP